MASTAALGLTVLRVTLGAIFLMHAYLAGAVVGLDGIAGYTTRMGYPEAAGPALAWYLVLAHGVGGALLVLGLWTRWAALAQVPFLSPFLMLSRVSSGEATVLEVVLSIALLVAAILAAAWIAARVYAAGVLLYGQRPGIRALWRLMRSGT